MRSRWVPGGRRLDDVLVLRVFDEIADEFDVDLQDPSAASAQVGETAIPHAKVIERDLTTKLRQLVHDRS
jgi:hypothetical protein